MALLTIHGIGAAPGIGCGRAFLYKGPQEDTSADEHAVLPLGARGAEIDRFREALASAAAELRRLSAEVASRVGPSEAAIFEAQDLFLQDPALIDAVETAIRIEGRPALPAVRQIFENSARELDALEDEYLRARAADLRDVKARLAALLGVPPSNGLGVLSPGAVIIAGDLTPSDTAELEPGVVQGIVLAGSTPTSHAAILARGLGLPLVVAAGPAVWKVTPGQEVILDGAAGAVLVEPADAEAREYRSRASVVDRARGMEPTPSRDQSAVEDVLTRPLQASPNARVHQDEAASTHQSRAKTIDGHRVGLLANASTPAEARLAISNGAEGIGLLRTEFLPPILRARETPPDEDAMAAAYGAVFQIMGLRPIVVRSLDAGGDKPLQFIDFEAEANPFLGWRGIRVLLDRPELFISQTRALLRAASRHGTDLRLMFPMVSSLDELREARRLVATVAREPGTELRHPLQLGVMIEVPAAALMADALAQEADFFSLGTNDLVQYTLVRDRGNARVAGRCRFWDPAVLRLVDITVRAAHTAGRPIGVCGEAAGDELGLPLLVGLGVDELSMGPARLPGARERLSSLCFDQLREMAAEALKKSSAEEVASLFAEQM
jgi:phosphoenolpyruvate-protein kinase (PTS system EI component)